LKGIAQKKEPASYEWIGNIPTDWKIEKLKRILISPLMYGTNEAAELEDKDLPRYIRITDFNVDGILREDTFKSLPFDKAEGYYLKEGDVLFARSGATVGKSFIFNNYKGRACFAGYLIKASPNPYKLLPDFLYYYTQSSAYDIWCSSIFTQATIQNISATKYAYLPIPLPSITIQQRIAAYLDKTCAAIDKAIEAKQKQLEILDALRKSIIHKAVTRGLDDLVELKDSGVEWLGRIPKHWRIEKLKRLLSQPLMYGTNEAAELDDPEYPRYIRITDFGDNGTLKPESFKSLPPDKAEGYYLKEGDLLFARSGATVGKSFLFSNYKGLACFAGYLIRARTNKIKLFPKYLYYFTKSPAYFTWKNVIFTQATIQNISATKYAYLPVSVPSVNEQQLIIQYLDMKMKSLENMQSNLSDQISTLEQYRKSLIHECVTGKRRITKEMFENSGTKQKIKALN